MARFFEAPVGLFWNLRSAIVGIGPTPNDKLTKFKGLEKILLLNAFSFAFVVYFDTDRRYLGDRHTPFLFHQAHAEGDLFFKRHVEPALARAGCPSRDLLRAMREDLNPALP